MDEYMRKQALIDAINRSAATAKSVGAISDDEYSAIQKHVAQLEKENEKALDKRVQ